MSAPVWVLPCRTMTSGTGLVSGNSAEKLRATPSTAMVSAGAAPAQHAIAAIATSRNKYRDRFIRMLGVMLDMILAVGLHMVRFLQTVP